MSHKNEQMYMIRSDVRYRNVDGEGIVIRQKRGDVFVVNEIASRILEGVSQGQKVSSIIDDIYREYEEEKDTIDLDVETILGEFEQLGVIEAK